MALATPIVTMKAESDSGVVGDLITNVVRPAWDIEVKSGMAIGYRLLMRNLGVEIFDHTVVESDYVGDNIVVTTPAFTNGVHETEFKIIDNLDEESGWSTPVEWTLDTTAPVLSAATGVEDEADSAIISITTNKAGGTMYIVVTDSATVPTDPQIIAGQDHTGDFAYGSNSRAVTATGAQVFNELGLVDAGTRYVHALQVDVPANTSNTVTSASWTQTGVADWNPNASIGATIFWSDWSRTSSLTLGGEGDTAIVHAGDLTGNDRHFYQDDPLYAPVQGTVNSLSTALFRTTYQTGYNAEMQTPNFSYAAPFMVFMMYRPVTLNSSTIYPTLFQGAAHGGAGTNVFIFGPIHWGLLPTSPINFYGYAAGILDTVGLVPVINTTYIIALQVNGADSVATINGVDYPFSVGSSGIFSGVQIGDVTPTGNSGGFYGHMGEMWAVAGLNATDKSDGITYLTDKWT